MGTSGVVSMLMVVLLAWYAVCTCRLYQHTGAVNIHVYTTHADVYQLVMCRLDIDGWLKPA